MADPDELFFISVAARRLGMHPQTLRKYERLGLIRPARTLGSVRLYSRAEVDRLRLIRHLVDEAGVNLAGVQRLLEIAECVERMRPLMRGASLTRAEARRRLAQELDRLSGVLGL
jgi:MerR family transcriptional regulator/heat shock protein HspR